MVEARDRPLHMHMLRSLYALFIHINISLSLSPRLTLGLLTIDLV